MWYAPCAQTQTPHRTQYLYTLLNYAYNSSKKKKIQNKYEKHQLVDYRTVAVAYMGCLCMRSIAQNGNAQCVNIHIDTMCRVWSYIYAIFVCVWAVYIGDYGGCAEGHDATSLALENVYWQRFSIIINVTHSIGDYYEYQTRGVGMSVKFAALLWHFFRIFILCLFNIFQLSSGFIVVIWIGKSLFKVSFIMLFRQVEQQYAMVTTWIHLLTNQKSKNASKWSPPSGKASISATLGFHGISFRKTELNRSQQPTFCQYMWRHLICIKPEHK